MFFIFNNGRFVINVREISAILVTENDMKCIYLSGGNTIILKNTEEDKETYDRLMRYVINHFPNSMNEDKSWLPKKK